MMAWVLHSDDINIIIFIYKNKFDLSSNFILHYVPKKLEQIIVLLYIITYHCLLQLNKLLTPFFSRNTAVFYRTF